MANKKEPGGYGFFAFTAVCMIAVLSGAFLRERTEPQIFQSRSFLGSPRIASTQRDVPTEGNYFDQLVELLKREYVDEVTDEMKLATGAVRGMIMSLNDLDSFFYDSDEFPIVVDALNGKYKGIGADLGFKFPARKPGELKVDEDPAARGLPQLTVVSVVPNGPAAQAGLKAGDWFESVDGAWIINSLFIERAREIQRKVQAKELPATKLDELRKEMNAKMDHSISPLRAWRKLMSQTGKTRVQVHRGGELLTFQIDRAEVRREVEAPALRPSFLPGSETAFGKAIQGKKSLTFDLRGASLGDYRVAKAYLERLLPKGKYGALAREGKSAVALTLQTGAPQPPAVTVMVDGQTRGVPELFALVLKSKGGRVVGSSAGEPIATEINPLPDGSGYTLAIGKWTAGGRA